jgi:hypothetical protein
MFLCLSAVLRATKWHGLQSVLSCMPLHLC